MGRVWSLVWVVVIAAARPSAADNDNRPGDRFFFGVAGGATDDGGFGVASDTSYWPSDYVGITVGTTIAGTNQSGKIPTSNDTDLGTAVVLAVPLRYVQPYGGLWFGFERSVINSQGTGLDLDYQPVLGLNGYVSRNLRAYVQWRPMAVHLGGDTSMDPTANLFTAGFRWSPDLFHAARPVNKVDVVWGTVALSALVFILINVGSG